MKQAFIHGYLTDSLFGPSYCIIVSTCLVCLNTFFLVVSECFCFAMSQIWLSNMWQNGQNPFHPHFLKPLQIQFSHSNLLLNINTNYWHAIGGFALLSTETLVSLLLLVQLIRGLLVVLFHSAPNEDFLLCFLGDLIRIWKDSSGREFMCSMQNMFLCIGLHTSHMPLYSGVFTHTHVIPTLYFFFFLWKTKLGECLSCFLLVFSP